MSKKDKKYDPGILPDTLKRFKKWQQKEREEFAKGNRDSKGPYQ